MARSLITRAIQGDKWLWERDWNGKTEEKLVFLQSHSTALFANIKYDTFAVYRTRNIEIWH